MTQTTSRTRYAHQIRRGDMPITMRTEATYATPEAAAAAAAAEVPSVFCENLPQAQRKELWADFTADTWVQVWSYGPRRTDRGYRYQWHPLNLR